MRKGGKIAVLCGGWSAERPISLLSGESVLRALKQAGHDVVAFDLLPCQVGQLRRRLPKPATPAWALRLPFERLAQGLAGLKVKRVFLALHGPGGEDGKVQGILEMLDLPYTGSSQLASTLAMNKHIAKEVLKRAGVPVPPGVVALKGQKPPRLALPCVVKPADQGSAIGVSIVRKRPQLAGALRKAWAHGAEAVVERYIAGRELTVGVLGSRALPLVEIEPVHAFYDYHSKYAPGGSRHLCPAPLPPALARKVQAVGLKAHQALGCRGFSRVDVMLDRAQRPWVLEVNTLPGLTSVSLLPDAAKAAGLSYPQLLEAMLAASAGKDPWASTKA